MYVSFCFVFVFVFGLFLSCLFLVSECVYYVSLLRKTKYYSSKNNITSQDFGYVKKNVDRLFLFTLQTRCNKQTHTHIDIHIHIHIHTHIYIYNIPSTVDKPLCKFSSNCFVMSWHCLQVIVFALESQSGL